MSEDKPLSVTPFKDFEQLQGLQTSPHLERLQKLGPAWERLLTDGEFVLGGKITDRRMVKVGTKDDGSENMLEVRKDILGRIPQVYAENNSSNPQDNTGITEGITQTSETPQDFVQRIKSAGGYVLSFSGFASASNHEIRYNYTQEAVIMLHIFDWFRSHRTKIALGLHGGTKNGIPALANILAATYATDNEEQIVRMGCTPTVGLRSLGEAPVEKVPMDYLHVIGTKYGDESASVAAPSDVLICLGGGYNSVKEIAGAKAHGGTALVIRLNKYKNAPTNTADYSDETKFPGNGKIIFIEEDNLAELPHLLETICPPSSDK